MATTEADPDAALVAAAKRDRAAFAPLYARYVDRIYRYCAARLDSKEAAEDATSHIFAKALAALGSCDDQRFGGWLFAIARTTIVDHHRSTRATRPLTDVAAHTDHRSEPESTVIAAEQHALRIALLDHLPPAQREVVLLRMAGLTGEEIATTLGRSLGSIKMLQLRAVTRLRELASSEENS